jgi:hypothetical protein
MHATVTLEFRGHLPSDSFADFANDRAAWLSLGHSITSQDGTRATIRLNGPEPLIDAFEMALSLGPADCIVLDVRRAAGLP